jgi:hypothetical protein
MDKKNDIAELINEIKQLRSIIENLEIRVNNTNDVLINHISFINNVYNTIKQPLFYIMNKVNNIQFLKLKNNQP